MTLYPPCRMHGGDAAGEVADFDARETGLGNHLRERVLRRKPADAFGEITISLAVFRHPFAELRQHRKGIALIQRIEPRRFHMREFQTEKPPAWFQDPPHFSQCRLDM